MQALLARIGITRNEVEALSAPAPHGREMLVSEALRPAATTERWQPRAKTKDFDAAADRALASLAMIEAANAEEEALAIAVALREAVEDERQDRRAGDARPRAGAPRRGRARALAGGGGRFRRRLRSPTRQPACSRGSRPRPRSAASSR